MFIMHLLVPAELGPIVSGKGPELPPEIQQVLGRSHFGHGGRYAIACDPNLKMDGEVHRGTHAHPPSVSCRKCRESVAFQVIEKAWSAGQAPHDVAVSELPDGCC